MHDGSVLRFRSVPDGYDPTDRTTVEDYVRDRTQPRRDRDGAALPQRVRYRTLHELNQTPPTALNAVPYGRLCPGADELAKLQEDFR